jgi:2-oxoglutarate ferredoxin oxidoreductase subunit alpha
VLFAYYLGHGDTKNILLFPATVQECFEFGTTSFNLAEELQTPVFVMSDLDLGMNTWMTNPFDYPEEPIKRGKVLTEEEVEEHGFYRYVDVDGDGITYRTLPGNKHPKSAYLNRGTGHSEYAVYSEKPGDWIKNMERLSRKFETTRNRVPGPLLDEVPEAEFGIISFGSTLPAIEESRFRLDKQGIRSNLMRLRALPINEDVRAFVAKHDRNYIIEMNHDAQLHRILCSELPDLATRLLPLNHMDGMPLTASWIEQNIAKKEVKQ